MDMGVDTIMPAIITDDPVLGCKQMGPCPCPGVSHSTHPSPARRVSRRQTGSRGDFEHLKPSAHRTTSSQADPTAIAMRLNLTSVSGDPG